MSSWSVIDKLVATKRRLMVGAIVAAVVLLLIGIVWISRPCVTSEMMLKEFWQAAEAYSKDPKHSYPPMANTPGAFWPDLDAVLPYCKDPDRMRAYLTGQCGVRVCYFGVFLHTPRFANVFLDVYEKRGIEAVLHERIDVSTAGLILRPDWGGRSSELPVKDLCRLGYGFERFLSTEIGNPAGSAAARHGVPIMWEMPDERDVEGGWVLYHNGETQWLPYPGNFPLTEPFIRRIRNLMSPTLPETTAVASEVDSRPPSWFKRPSAMTSPVYPFALQVIDCLPAYKWKIVHCDTRPRLYIDGSSAYQIDIDARPPKRRKRFGGHFPAFELDLFPLGTRHAAMRKEDLPRRGRARAAATYLGAGQGYQWFIRGGNLDAQDNIRMGLGIMAEDERLEVIREALYRKPSDPLYESFGPADALYVLPRFGERALPLLKEYIDATSDGEAVVTVETIGGSKAESLIQEVLMPGNPRMIQTARSILSRPLQECIPRSSEPSDALLEKTKQALLASTDYPALAEIAVRFVPAFYGETSRFNERIARIGSAVLNHLPEDIRASAIRDIHQAVPNDAHWPEFIDAFLAGKEPKRP